MWTTVALIGALSLAPAQAGSLRLSNDRLTYGLWGSDRPDNQYYPGDQCFIGFDVENLKVGGDGKVRYRLDLEATDGKGKQLFKQTPQDVEAVASLGGSTMPVFASVDLGLQMPPGEYTVKVTVTADKASASLTKKVRVRDKAFALVRPQLAMGGVPVAPVAVAGQDMLVGLTVVGFERAKKGGQPNVAFELKVLDEKKSPTLDKPLTGEIKADVPEKALSLPVQYLLKLNRPGKFTVVVKATDRTSGKTAEVSLPVQVLKPVR